MCSVFNGRGARRPRRYRRSGFIVRGGLLAAACLLLAACSEGGGLGFGYKTDGMSEEEFLKISVRWITCLWSRYNHEEAPRTPVTELMPPEMYFLDAFAKPELMKERQQAYYGIFEETCHEYGYDTAAYNTIFRAHKVGYYYAADENHVVPILRRVDRRGLLNRLGDAAARLFLTAGADCDDDGAWEMLFSANIPSTMNEAPSIGDTPAIADVALIADTHAVAGAVPISDTARTPPPVSKRYALRTIAVRTVDCAHDGPFPACDAITATIVSQTPGGHVVVRLRNNKRVWMALNDLDADTEFGIARRAFADEHGDFLLGPKETRTVDLDLKLELLRSSDGIFAFTSKASVQQSNARVELGPISGDEVKMLNVLNALCIPVGGWDRDCMELLGATAAVLGELDQLIEAKPGSGASKRLNQAITTSLKSAGMNSGEGSVHRIRQGLQRLGSSKSFSAAMTAVDALDLYKTIGSIVAGDDSDIDVVKAVGLGFSIIGNFYLLLSKSEKAGTSAALGRVGEKITVKRAARLVRIADRLLMVVTIAEGLEQLWDAATTPDPFCLEFTGTIAYE